MKFLFWKISKDHMRIAKFHWFLYKLFGIKRITPCGFSKKDKNSYCALFNTRENSVIINEGDTHEIRCKVCGRTHMISSEYIKDDYFENPLEW